MHIAICDDNIADRKQLERLLSREADRRLHDGEALYIDSFGNISSLMGAPKIYDVFFIDMTSTEDEDGLYVANLLRTDLVDAPIVLCSSTIDYESFHSTIPNLIYLKKEVKTADITTVISEIISLKQQEQPTYEIRSSQKTYYIHEEDFAYAERVNSRQSHVYFTDGTSCDFPEAIEHFMDTLQKHPHILMLRKGYLINSSFISKLSFSTLTLTTGTQIPLAFGESFQIKHILKS